MERSLVLIKPDAMKKGFGGAIIGRLQEKGLKLLALRMLQMDRELAGKHYAVHADKPFYGELIDFITSTPIIAAVFEADGAVSKIRDIMGGTDPAKAKAGTIRRDFGQDIQRNATHASDSPETAEKEIRLFFRDDEIYAIES